MTELMLEELVTLGAVDDEIFARGFFPNTFRQPSPSKQRALWDALSDPTKPYVLAEMFRGAGKTTVARTFVAKRVAYSLAPTVLFVSASETHATRSILWLRNNVEKNGRFAGAFGLRPGKRWNETELEIVNTVTGFTCYVLGLGVTAPSMRGINFEDYRPSTIVLDDPLNDENAATLEQREKLSDIISGALEKSLAPVTEAPNRKLLFTQTPMNADDAAGAAKRSRKYYTVTFPCWTDETLDLPVDRQISSWEERYPTAELRQQKRDAINENKLSIFAREMECRLTSSELSAFKPDWLVGKVVPGASVRSMPMLTVISIDPVPPPSDRQVAKNLHGKDFEVHSVLGLRGGQYYLLEQQESRGHEPSWSVKTALELARKYRSARIVVEAVAYQKTLQWLLEQEMKRTGIYFPVIPYTDKRSKFNRIVSTLGGVAAQGRFIVAEECSAFLSQFNDYPRVSHDDHLDSAAIGLSNLINPFLELQVDEYADVIPDTYNSDRTASDVFVPRCP